MKPLKQIAIDRYAAIFLTLTIIFLGYSGLVLHRNMVAIEKDIKHQEKVLLMGNEMEDIINTLSDLARSFVNTYSKDHLEEYWYQVDTIRIKDRILSDMSLIDIPDREGIYLIQAKERSDKLEEVEVHSMRLIMQAMDYDTEDMPMRISDYRLPIWEDILPKEKKIELAGELVFGQEYRNEKKEIRSDISKYRKVTEQRIAQELNSAIKTSNDAFNLQKIFLLILLMGGLIILLFYYTQTALPIVYYTDLIGESSNIGEIPRLIPKGSRELRELIQAFNINAEEKAMAETSLRETEYKLKLHVHSMPLAAIEYDNDFIITHWNQAAGRIFGFTREEAIGKCMTDFIVPDNIMEEVKDRLLNLSSGDKYGEISINKNITKDGNEIICEWYNTPICDPSDNIIGWMSLGKDITLEREEQDRILYLSQHDPLTRLYNRGFIMEQLEIENARFKRTGIVFSIMILDIDFFKKVNDNYGHEAGDMVLKRVSDIMSGTVRETDFVGRWGGEEFIIILPFTDIEGAHTLAEKIRKNIENEQFIYNEKVLNITITAGVSCFCKIDYIEDCIRQADDALLYGKRTGRNRVVDIKCQVNGISE